MNQESRKTGTEGNGTWIEWPPEDTPLLLRLKTGEVIGSFYSDGWWWREQDQCVHPSDVAAWQRFP